MKKILFGEVGGRGKILIFIVIAVCVAFAFLVVLVFLHNSELPQTVDELHWKVGDTWTYSGKVRFWSGEGLDRILIEKVVGEERIDGKDCYVEIITLEPYGVLVLDADVKYLKLWVEKDTFETKQAFFLAEGNFPVINVSYRNEFAQELFPLEVGKESRCTISTRATNYLGEIPPQESNWKSVSVVRAKENVETPAGTFECFMISTYENDIGGAPIWEWAYSPKVLNVVRSNSSEAIIENRDLVSYELQPRG